MNIYLLDNLEALQRHLAEYYQLHQVVKNDHGQYHWQQHSGAIFPALLHEKPQSSVKNYFFAQQENILTFNGEYFQESIPKPAPFVLFGVQSCDLVAVHYQDQFFKDDVHYQARRQQCLLVGLDCITPCQNGFCPTVDAGPGVRNHTADLILHPLAQQHELAQTSNADRAATPQYLLIVSTEKGTHALEGLDLNAAPQNKAHWHFLTQRDLTLKNCEEMFPDDNYLTKGIAKINANAVSAEFWQSAAIQCLGCSGCTTLCPTCSCFGTRSTKSVSDESNKTTITQQRFWDSCLYEGFQKEASFHNPTEQAGKRVERFWRHKFSDGIAKAFDRYGCVGCGRCEQTCPGVIGVHSIMKRITNDA